MKILITGGAGFIGSQIADKYINIGHDVIIIDNLISGRKEYINKKAVFYPVDIEDKKQINEIFLKEKPDILNHHAAQMSVRNSVEDPLYDARVNIIGLLNLMEAGRQNGLKKVIFASSGGVVYGDAKIIPTSEDYVPKNPLSPYGVSKLTGENYLYFYWKNYDIAFVALRYANVYGPRQNPHGEAGVVAIFSQKLLKSERPTINGTGKQTRDYIFVSDVVDANTKVLDADYIGSLNIGTGKETDVNTIFTHLKSLTKSNLDPLYGPIKMGEQQRSSLDIRSARKSIDWMPKVGLKQGLSMTVDHFQNRHE